jgi:chitosanase
MNKKTKIQQIVNCFETGSAAGNYGDVSIFYDGPGGVKQITYGKSQTTASGHLQDLLKRYVEAKGVYANDIAPYVARIKSSLGLWADQNLIAALKLAGKDPIMVATQDAFFDEKYWLPALKWFSNNGFTLPLSMLVIYDSFIHSGGILDFLRKRFTASTPKNGGREKDWIEQYLTTRQNWLMNHSNKILRKTIYRTRDMLREVKEGDWQLDTEFIANGTKIK